LRPQAHRLSAATAAIPKRIIGRQKTKDTPRSPANSIADGIAKATFWRNLFAAHLWGFLQPLEPAAELLLEPATQNCQVPAEHLIGTEGGGGWMK
jgi:hypothetical protein